MSPRDPFSAIYSGIAAYAQYVGRNYDEAIRFARASIRQRSDFVGAHRVLTASAGMAGRPEVAAALGIAETTVKTHLSRVFDKTGAGRQADLVKLVAGFSSPLAS